ncbi:alpha-ribazole phosphatase family protein [Niveibacterium terrae]|uniref:alpha-ribazole phosphatase family protein n=1 Tax=Niveibacterium terrae TaxID=3373598 RepID=UPI003A92C089
MELALIRHPPVAVAAGLCYGASDVALAASPDQDIARLKALLPESFALWSSPLTRCRQLAEGLGEARLDQRLAEIDFGEWEMKSFDTIGRAALNRWALDPVGHVPPGGESALQMAERALAFLAERQVEGGSQVFVAHGGPLRAIAGQLLGLAPERWLALDFAPARLARFALDGRGARLLGFNL